MTEFYFLGFDFCTQLLSNFCCHLLSLSPFSFFIIIENAATANVFVSLK